MLHRVENMCRIDGIILFNMSFCFIAMQIYDVLTFLIRKLCLNV